MKKSLGLIIMLAMVMQVACSGNKSKRRGQFNRGRNIQGPTVGKGGSGEVPPATANNGGQVSHPGPNPGTNPGTGGGQANVAASSIWGVITPSNANVFYNGKTDNYPADDNVRLFLNTNLAADSVGGTTGAQDWHDVKCMPGSCGILFSVGLGEGNSRSPLRLQNGVSIQQAMNDGGYVPVDTNTGGNISIGIYDSLVGTQQNGETLSIIPVFINLISNYTDRGYEAYVQGSNFYIAFEDQLGYLALEGTINGQASIGTVTYYNYKSFNGSEGVRGPNNQVVKLGDFRINTCAMFPCQ